MLIFVCSLVGLFFVCDSWVLVQLFLFISSVVYMLESFSTSGLIYVSDFFLLDTLGFSLILLSYWVVSLMVVASKKVYFSNNFKSFFLVVSVSLLFCLLMSFSALNFLCFYVMFESSLIPTLVLILGWGYQPERVQAGVYMLFYTLFASLPLLFFILNFNFSSGSLFLGLVDKWYDYNLISFVVYISAIFGFLVKLPMFMFHLWLPKAHVEAPVAGSMILAGVLLKLGGYGLFRILSLFLEVCKKTSFFFIGLSLLGGFLISLVCLMQVDMKSLIAYSSVAHMSLVLAGFLIFNSMSVGGGVVVMIGHGLCSSGLFCIANMSYERVSSRSLLVSKGLVNLMPTMCMWWFLLSAGNMAAPPSLNLLGEVMLIVSVGGWSKVSMLYLGLLSFFSASYSLYLFSMSQHGKYYNSLFSFCPGKSREYLVLFLHWVPLNIIFLNSNILLL